jgi:hypothetical protein
LWKGLISEALNTSTGLRQDVKAASRLLLRFLLLRLGSVPANPTGRGALLHSDFRPKFQRLAGQRAHRFSGVVASYRSYRCGPAGERPIADGHLGCGPRMDGNCLPTQCEAIGTHPLPVHRTLLPCDDRPGANARGHGRPSVRLARPGRANSLGRQDHLVGDRAGVGNLLIAEFVKCRTPLKAGGARWPTGQPFLLLALSGPTRLVAVCLQLTQSGLRLPSLPLIC